MGILLSSWVAPTAAAGRPSAVLPRLILRLAGAATALLLLYAAWQGYRNPDFLLGLAAFRLC
jgi:hypothetical protein